MHGYSQPLLALPSRSHQPAWQEPIEHVAALHRPAACGYVHALPHRPQLFGSISRREAGTSSMIPLQSSSAPLHDSPPPSPDGWQDMSLLGPASVGAETRSNAVGAGPRSTGPA